jgi:mxaA protein
MRRSNVCVAGHGARGATALPAAAAALLAVIALFMARQTLAAEAPALNATVEQPRAFGYVVGDIATQRVLLDQQGFTAPDALPAAGPLGNWVERHAVRVERDARGRRWLAVEYQIMNSPQSLTAVTLPAWRLKSKNSNTELLVPQWQISVGSLTPRQAFAQTGLGALRPDRAAPVIDLAPLQRWINVWAAAAVVLLLAWAGWWAWRNWRASASQPFARALRELRGIDEQSPEAWYAIHRALDATAGRVVQKETSAALFAHAPQFLAERAAIERFLDASTARFFDASAPERAPPAPSRPAIEGLFSLRTLCSSLRRIEKRHEP